MKSLNPSKLPIVLILFHLAFVLGLALSNGHKDHQRGRQHFETHISTHPNGGDDEVTSLDSESSDDVEITRSVSPPHAIDTIFQDDEDSMTRMCMGALVGDLFQEDLAHLDTEEQERWLEAHGLCDHTTQKRDHVSSNAAKNPFKPVRDNGPLGRREPSLKTASKSVNVVTKTALVVPTLSPGLNWRKWLDIDAPDAPCGDVITKKYESVFMETLTDEQWQCLINEVNTCRASRTGILPPLQPLWRRAEPLTQSSKSTGRPTSTSVPIETPVLGVNFDKFPVSGKRTDPCADAINAKYANVNVEKLTEEQRKVLDSERERCLDSTTGIAPPLEPFHNRAEVLAPLSEPVERPTSTSVATTTQVPGLNFHKYPSSGNSSDSCTDALNAKYAKVVIVNLAPDQRMILDSEINACVDSNTGFTTPLLPFDNEEYQIPPSEADKTSTSQSSTTKSPEPCPTLHSPMSERARRKACELAIDEKYAHVNILKLTPIQRRIRDSEKQTCANSRDGKTLPLLPLVRRADAPQPAAKHTLECTDEHIEKLLKSIQNHTDAEKKQDKITNAAVLLSCLQHRRGNPFFKGDDQRPVLTDEQKKCMIEFFHAQGQKVVTGENFDAAMAHCPRG